MKGKISSLSQGIIRKFVPQDRLQDINATTHRHILAQFYYYNSSGYVNVFCVYTQPKLLPRIRIRETIERIRNPSPANVLHIGSVEFSKFSSESRVCSPR